MALDAKAIKEEIPDKDVYETTTRRSKGNCLLNHFQSVSISKIGTTTNTAEFEAYEIFINR